MNLSDLSAAALILSGALLLLAASGIALDIHNWWHNRTTGKWLRQKAEREAARRRHPSSRGRRMVNDLWAQERHQWDDEGEAYGPGDVA